MIDEQGENAMSDNLIFYPNVFADDCTDELVCVGTDDGKPDITNDPEPDDDLAVEEDRNAW